MLLREKYILLLVVLACCLSFLYFNTEKGSQFWENYFGSPDRYAIMQNSKIGYVNARGDVVIRPQFNDGIHYFSGGLAPVVIGNQWGFIDGRGNTVIAPQFTWADKFSEDLAVVAVPVKTISMYGYIDSSGGYAIEPKFLKANGFSEGLACVNFQGAWGYINKAGEWVIQPKFDEARDFSQGLAAIRSGRHWGFIDRKGTIVIEPSFYEAGLFKDGLAPVAMTQNWWAYIDQQGQIAIGWQFDSAHAFREGLAAVSKKYSKGYVDTAGKMVIEKNYFSDVKDFSQGLAAVRVNAGYDAMHDGQWGYIDRSGEIVIEPRFDWASDFHGGLARVGIGQNDVRRGYCNPKGKLIWDPANWEVGSHIRQNTLISIGTLVLLYFIFLFVSYGIRAHKASRYEVALLKEQAAMRKGAVSGGGMFSDASLSFEQGTARFRLYLVKYFIPHFHEETYLEADLLSAQERDIKFFVNLDFGRVSSMNLVPPAVIQTGNASFDQMVKIPKAGDEKYVLGLFNDVVQKRLLESRLLDSVFIVGITKGKFMFRINRVPVFRGECDWIIDTAFIFYERIKELEKNRTLL
ncbi:MAG TPA: WG repeat-containing protein [Candidatus Omnitrophota bacterium]|nr:WG repeat-containing protein [Candidatus Omnitrophota bacterium]HPD85454.1 WG repeat-containing protein [Candidatus Omnitrophota bacterium]HRZ04045.1 WG repeat-containing protein [Candidatus Omnitrophota bacterium]